MKTVICHEPGSLELIEREEPVAVAGEALLAVRRVGVCGTDLHAFVGDQPFFSYPRVLGHELAAEILEIGENSYGLSRGDRVVVVPYVGCQACVACRRGAPNCCQNIEVMGVHRDGGMREFMTAPIRQLVPASDLDFDQAALVECLSIGAHAVSRAQVQAGENVVVIGAGPIGLGVAQFARRRGARVLMVDRSEPRLAFWRDALCGTETVLANEETVAAIKDLTHGEGATCVFDCTGSGASMRAALEHVAHSGKLIFVGLVKTEIGWLHPDLHKRETTVLCSRNALRSDFEEVIAGIREGHVSPSCMITHRTTLDGVATGIPHWIRPESGALKPIVEIGSTHE